MKKILSLLAVAALVSLLHAVPANAQSAGGAGQPLHIVVPFAPGGAQDVIARWLATKLTTRMGVPVVIDNKAGAGGVIAAESVAKAAPDGNTVFLASGGAISIAPHLNAKLTYDPLKDFAPVALVADTPMTLAVRSQSPYQTVADVLKDAKARPKQVTFASTGNGTISHLTGELFAQTAGVQLLHVPYRGAAPAMTDLMGGQVAMIVTSAASITPMVEDKRARVLATFTTHRLGNLPDVPTMNEASGLKGLEVPVWVAVLAPAKTPKAVVDKLAAEVEAVCKLPETLERFNGLGALTTCGGPSEAGKVVNDDYARWGRVIRQANIKAE
ncbi:MAG TPA: tripartite tricarboxylate transporter substrate binding protein [Ramlibacter sp.]|uniref:Bug family tripartite tricarboxylate transporter substrate binding protein n=1 Tax=Ramlibacter sp. TaxID=1917967 RepID=UPI002CB4FBAF|nr:tripartite tricarboxylate transporter substrate binding protein [Ramlibacter sp.]HVZ42449.1 tripartite tricarboxylate transporter substrate binding protein [Ramlibacter sp.]